MTKASRAGAIVCGCVLAMAVPGNAPATRDESDYGAYLAGGCFACHDSGGRGQAIPPIAGLTEAELEELLNAYRMGRRDNATMRVVATGLGARDVAALAAYLQTIEPR